MRFRAIFVTAVYICIFGVDVSFARHLGTVGNVYPVVEPDALAEIKEAAARVDWEKAMDRQTNGITERFNQTLLDEFYSVYFRKKVYTTLEEIQVDLNNFLEEYNLERTNQGKYCKGRTPMETFTEGLDLCRQYLHDGQNVIQEAA